MSKDSWSSRGIEGCHPNLPTVTQWNHPLMHLLAPANARNLRPYKREAPEEVDVNDVKVGISRFAACATCYFAPNFCSFAPAVCGSGFDARFEPYQRPRLSRYNAGR